VENVKQHWVPQSYLSAWCDPASSEKKKCPVWVFPKEGGVGRPEVPKNIFWEREMYTIHLPNGERDLTLEHGLSSLEDDFARLRRDKLEPRLALAPADAVTL
jgi:hypothetical protein